jgi:hypothetical protein
MKIMTKHSDWTDERVTELIKLVLSTKIHLNDGKAGILDDLESLVCKLHQQPSFLGVSRTKGDARKIREKYKKVIVRVIEFMARGNLSKKDGELAPLLSNIQQIIFDLSAEQEKKADDGTLKRKVTENEEIMVFGGAENRKKPVVGFGLRKSMDGSFEGSLETPSPSFETLLLEALTPVPSVSPSERAAKEDEERIEIAMLDWALKGEKAMEDVVKEAALTGDGADQLSNFGNGPNGAELLISIYCTRGANFSAEPFKAALRAEGVRSIACHKVYALMQKWRRAASAGMFFSIVYLLHRYRDGIVCSSFIVLHLVCFLFLFCQLLFVHVDYLV